MLAAIGVDSTAELFEQIPEPLRLGRPLALPAGMSEAEVYERLAELASRNADAEEQVCFLGAGMYDHYVPAIVDAITQRSEFLTPYTPYQPCLLYTSDAADDLLCVDLGGRRIIKKKKNTKTNKN